MTTNDRLAEIKARAEAATEGSWLNVGLVVCSTTTHEDVADTVVEPVNLQQLANAEFIAHARTDVPALVAALEAVLDLHQPFEWSFGFGPVQSCKHCAEQGANEEKAHYPCPTVQAVTEALGGDQ